MKVTLYFKLRFLFLFEIILLSFLFSKVSAQVLISGTSFTPKEISLDSNYYSIDDIEYYGVQKGLITVTPPLASSVSPDDFNATFQYAITSNPSVLDAERYVDLSSENNYQLVVSGNSPSRSNILDYELSGLAPNSEVEVIINMCSPVKSSLARCLGSRASVKGVINPDQYNANSGQDSPQLLMGQCGEYSWNSSSFSSYPVRSDGSVNFRINNTMVSECNAVSIKSIEIYGYPEPEIYAVQGNEICVGEEIILESILEYNGNYQWQVLENETWKTFATSTRAVYELSKMGSNEFRLVIENEESSFVSKQKTINAIQCCKINDTPAGRQTVFHENFGRLDLSDPTGNTFFIWDYSDLNNPVEVKVTTEFPFRRELNTPPAGTVFSSSGPIMDGEYTVAAYLTNYTSYNGIEGARLEWAGNVTGPIERKEIAYDHSGRLDGAALFVNPVTTLNTQNIPLYSKTIKNTCENTHLSFEAWITVSTNLSPGSYTPIDITLRVTDLSEPNNIVEVNKQATREADGGGEWEKISGEITLNPNSSGILLEVIDTYSGSMGSGNHIVLDDIKVDACAPPTVNMFLNKNTLSQSAILCTDTTTLFASTTDLLQNFYNETPYYLYQYSTTPEDVSSWINLGLPQPSAEFSFSKPIQGVVYGDEVSFRVIVATQEIFNSRNNFVGELARQNDFCRNYSVSSPVNAIIECPPCVKADPFTISVNPEDFTICPNDTAILTVGPLKRNNIGSSEFDISWFLVSAASEQLIKGPSEVEKDTFKVSYANVGEYLVRVRDKTQPESVACYVEAAVSIMEEPKNSSECDIVTGNSEKLIDDERKIYPNPSSNYIYLGDDAVSARLYNSLGKVVKSKYRNSFTIEDLPAGVYNVIVTYNTGESISHKLIIR